MKKEQKNTATSGKLIKVVYGSIFAARNSGVAADVEARGGESGKV